jgi:uncharacterized protein YeaO (DUF488 family)
MEVSCMKVQLKRAYEEPGPDDGFRILVDRLWPRGVPKASAHIDLWFKDIAPSPELRKWYGHEPSRWPEFRTRYFAELDGNPEAVAQLRQLVRRGPVTLVYAAKDQQHSHAVALLDYLKGAGKGVRRA